MATRKPSGATAPVEGAVKQAVEVTRARLMFIIILVALSFIAVCLRLVELSFASTDVRDRHVATYGKTDITLARADIVDRNGVLLATNLKTASLYANPKEILDPKETVEKLAGLFPELNKAALLKRISGEEKSFVWVKHYLTPGEQEQVLNLGQPGLEFMEEEKRTYPQGNLISHVLGFVGQDGKGLAGVERMFDNALESPDNQSAALQLSLDIRVQEALHDELKTRMVMHKAKAAAGLVMDANTGEVLALVSLPDFDPNLPATIKPDTAYNNATKSLYEMGSTFKTFNHAMALDSGKVRITDSFDASHPLKVGRFRISDYHAENRVLSVPEIYMHSSNIGSAQMADLVGSKLQQDYFTKFHLLDPLTLEIPETATPLKPAKQSRLGTMTMAYGHGIAVTPTHVAAAVAAVVNGGKYHRPTLIKGRGGEAEPVLKSSTSDKMRKLMRMVVADKGATGGKAAAVGYLVGGKTGTAEKPGGKHYDRNKLITSFVGAFPMDKPRYVVIAVLDEPHATKETFGFATAGWTAAPVISKLVTRIAPLLNVIPVDETADSVKKLFELDSSGKGQKLASQ